MRTFYKGDISGQTFGTLTVTRSAGIDKWLCRCVCGREVKASRHHLRSEPTCRICYLANSAKEKTTHGGNGTRLHGIWHKMKTRCGANGLPNYAGRGITVCQEWREFSVFREWALSNGYADGLQIDRINNDRDYEPANCRWVTKKQNTRNRSVTPKVLYGGERLSHGEVAERFGIPYMVLYRLLKRGLTVDAAISRFRLRTPAPS